MFEFTMRLTYRLDKALERDTSVSDQPTQGSLLGAHTTESSAERCGCCRRRSEDSTRSVDSMMVRLLVRPDGVSTLSSEGSGETAPVPVTLHQGQGQGEFSMRLSGGAGGSQKGASAHLDGSHASHGGR